MPKRIDIAGQQFGKWKVGSESRVHNGATQWKCRCKCGYESFVSAQNLRRGGTKGCMKCMGKDRQGKVLDLSGQQFGRWRVVGGWRRNSVNTFWKCKCECGRVAWVFAGNLRDGKTRGCQKCAYAERTRTKHPLYRYWVSVCKRGNVCGEWRESPESFYADVVSRPRGKYMHPIDCAQEIGPGNFQWKRTQYRRQVPGSVSWHARSLGISRQGVSHRIKSGWTLAEAVATPKGEIPERLRRDAMRLAGQKSVRSQMRRDSA